MQLEFLVYYDTKIGPRSDCSQRKVPDFFFGVGQPLRGSKNLGLNNISAFDSEE